MPENITDKRSNYLIDNRENRTIQKIFKDLENDIIKELCVAVGYFHVSGFNLIRQHLGNIKKIYMVIGTETDRATAEQLSKGHREMISQKISSDIGILNKSEEIESLSELYEYIKSGKIDVRVYTKNKFHAKAYIFKREVAHSNLAVVGSSNLSLRGMGGHDESNTELNIMEGNSAATLEFENWFEEIWNESEPYKDEIMKIIGNSPYFIRQKELGYVSPKEIFKTIVCEYDDFHMPTNDVLTKYQQAGVITAQNSIEHYGGCMISDSVGLGKTFMGIRLIEWAQNAGSNVLVLVPKSLKSNWHREIKRYFQNIKTSENRLKIMTITELSNLDLRDKNDVFILDSIKSNYDYIVIDEAHRFRNYGEFNEENEYSGTKKHANLNYLRKNSTKYVLLTATPINNSVMDMYHLINIFTDNSRLQNMHPHMNLESFKQYKKLDKSITDLKKEKMEKESRRTDYAIEQDISQKKTEQKVKLEHINNIINEVMVLRTRQNIVKDYATNNISGIPIITDIPKVIKTEYDSGKDYAEMYRDVEDLIISLKIPHIVMYKYQHVAINLSGLFRILLFKRLESGIHAFTMSINRLLEREIKFKQNVEKHGLTETILKLDNNYLEEDTELTDFIDEIDKTTNDTQNILDTDAIKNTDHDIDKIKKFNIKYFGKIILENGKYYDPKLEQLQKIIESITQQKILIFTQYADTAEYLYNNLGKFATKHKLNLDCVMGDPRSTAGNTTIDTDTKIQRFAPRANKILVEPKDEIDILITTDTLSEGVNLQDCAIIINYDLPWNPMKMVQRVGRVDRIGSTRRTTVFNIVPNKELEIFLSLLEKLESKITNITSIVGKESYILSEDEDLDPKTIGIRFKEARMATDYTRYENASGGRFIFHTSDAYGQIVLSLRQKMTEINISCSDDLPKVDEPYSIIQDNYEPYSFVVFRVYDKRTEKKIQNLIVVKDTLTKEFTTMDANDAKILRLAHVTNGVSKQNATPYEFDKHIDEIINYFESKQLLQIQDKTSIVNRPMVGKMYDAQFITITRLRQITNPQHMLDTGISNDYIQIAQKCENHLTSHTLTRSDATKLDTYYGSKGIKYDFLSISNKIFIEKTHEFIQKYIIKARGYTVPLEKNDIAYSIICKVASI